MKNKIAKIMMCALLIAFASFTVTSCGIVEDQLKEAIAAQNKNYPKELTNGITCKQIITEGKNVVYDCVVDSAIIDIDAVSSPEVKATMLEGLKEGYNTDEDVKTFIQFVVTADMAIVYRFTDEATNKKAEIAYDNGTLAGI